MKVKITATIIGIFALAFAFSSCEKDDDELNVVDLGLPSGNLWATCNVGASNPWDYGNYYAWGETETKSVFGYTTYKYWDNSNKTYTKYIDWSSSLEAMDDVATVIYGPDYSIPTISDWSELIGNCYWTWTSDYNGRGVSGYIVYKTKSNGNSYSLSDVHIFLPAAGLIEGEVRSYVDAGFYPSNRLNGYGPVYLWGTTFNNKKVSFPKDMYRIYGHTVRPIRRTK